MAETFKAASFPTIEKWRSEITELATAAADVETAAAQTAAYLHHAVDTCVLARMFLVAPMKRIAPAERAWAETFARSIGREVALKPSTPVLSLLGTSGKESAWNDRTRSSGHRAIPLIDKAFVEGAPMIAAVLSSLRIDLGIANDGEIELRTVQGGLNARFLVEDAQTTVDAAGRYVIGAREFATVHQVRSVWGMAGSYVTGEIAIAIIFTREQLKAADVDRFTSLVSSFKMATSPQLAAGRIYAAS